MYPLRTASEIFSCVDFDRYRIFETCDLDEARALCGRYFSPHKLQLVGHDKPLHARMDIMPMGPVSLIRMTWQAAVAVDPGCLDDYYLLCMLTKGHVEYRHGARHHHAFPGQLVIVGGSQRFHFSASTDYEQIVIRLDKGAVDEAWSALAGADPVKPISFHSEVTTEGSALSALESVLRLIANSAQGELATTSLPHLNTRLQDLLLTTLLLHQPHSLMQSRMPRARATPLCLKKAKGYMLDRMDQPLSLLLVAHAVGVPARTLQLAFQVAEDMGPMQWFRAQRLQAVHRALSKNGNELERITDTAYRFGFTHLGVFSQQYRKAFGETPSQTLARCTEISQMPRSVQLPTRPSECS